MNRLAGILIAGAMILSLQGCAFLQKRLAVKDLKLDFQGVSVTALTLDKINLEVNLEAFNPNDVEAVIDRLDYTVFIENRRAMSGYTDRTYRISPHGKKVIKLNATIRLVDLPDVFLAIKEAAKKRSVKTSADVKVHVKTILGTYTRTVKLEKYIPLEWK